MKISVTSSDDRVFQLEVADDLLLENLKALCEFECGVPAQQIMIYFKRRLLLNDKVSLKELQIRDGDLLTIEFGMSARPRGDSFTNMDFSAIEVPTTSNNQVSQDRTDRQNQLIRLFDPLDAKAQKLIAEEIRQKNIEANMAAAIEFNPENFGTVVMLYIDCHVNGFPVKAFIDSGAQTTIMSSACAERCNIMRLVDTRWSGIAKGVGTQRIIGRIHTVQLQIEKDFLTTSFAVLEEQPMDMLLGLDMLKRHQCNIDLERNVLRIGTTGTETTFLSEASLPDCARLTGNEDRLMQEVVNKPGASGQPAGDPSKISQSDKFTEADVDELTLLGFTRQQVVAELRLADGDKTQATAALFAKSFKF